MHARAWRRGGKTPTISLMIVPMIDVIFLLLLFFVVMSSFEASARLRIDLPRPGDSQARPDDSARSIVIHCEYRDDGSGGDGGVHYRLGGNEPQGLESVAARLAAAKALDPELTVVIRADRRLPFVDVRRVMEVVADCRIPVMKVAIIRSWGR